MLLIHPTTAICPGATFMAAVQRVQKIKPTFFGIEEAQCQWSAKVLHLCPQTREPLSSVVLDRLMATFPNIQFQLHANVPMENRNRPFDASMDWQSESTQEYVAWLKARCVQANAKRYSWHASGGFRANALDEAIANTKRLEDVLGIDVALEGLYTNPYGWALSTKAEYMSLMDCDVSYALDLSHLHIVHCQESGFSKEEVRHLLLSPNCKEVHVSHNDGKRDSHTAYPKDVMPFCMDVLSEVAVARPDLEIFSESRF